MSDRYSTGLARALKRNLFTAKAAAAETVSTTGGLVELGDAGSVHVEVIVTAATGTTPTLLVDVYGAADPLGANLFKIGTIGSNGFTVGGVAADPATITAAGTYRAELPAARFVQYRSRIGGTTPSFTYSVTVDAAG